jgi:hypothetical protein
MPPKRKRRKAKVAPKKRKRPSIDDRMDAMDAMERAVDAEDVALIDKLMAAGEDYKLPYYLACKAGSAKVALHMLSAHDCRPNDGLRYACSAGNLPIVQLMLSKGATDFNGGMRDGCWSGSRPIVELMISKGANSRWNEGMTGACHGGHSEIVDLMISKGANDWNEGLEMAARSSLPIVEQMISKGANNWTAAAKFAAEWHNLETTAFLLSKGADATIVFDRSRQKNGQPRNNDDDDDEADRRGDHANCVADCDCGCDEEDCICCHNMHRVQNCDAVLMFDLLTTTVSRRSLVSQVIGVERTFARLDELVVRTKAALVVASMPAVLQSMVVGYLCAV